MWPFLTRRPARPHTRRLSVELLEDRTAPANLRLDAAITVDASNVALPSPIYGQMIFVRANWSAFDMVGNEGAVPIRYTANYPANYFSAGSAPVAYPADGGTVNHSPGNTTWFWWRGGWYAGTAAFTVTATIDPNNTIFETNETDNSFTFTVTPVAPTNLPQLFVQPIGLTPNRDWAITNYADIDPQASQSDYRGGQYVYNGHDAIDAGPVGFSRQDTGIPLTAVADGVVDAIDGGNFYDRETSWNGGQNWNAVWVNHGNGYRTVYGHMAAGSQAVKVGDPVRAGQFLGLMGSSGISTGTHIHYTLYYRGSPVETGFSPSSYWQSPLPYAGDVPAFYFDAGVTNYNAANPAYDFSEYASQYRDFGSTPANQTIYFYVQPFNIKTTDQMYFQWIRPNGTVHQTSNFPPNANYTYSVWWWSHNLATFQNFVGTWQIVYYLNGTTPAHEQKRVPFTITSGLGSPSLKVSDPTSSNRIIPDNRTTPFTFTPTPLFGTAPTRSFTLLNHGTNTLNLTNYQLPPGFSLVSGPATLGPNTSTTLTVRMDTAVVGAKFGALTIDTNDPDIGRYEIVLNGTVTGGAPAAAPVIALTGIPAAVYNFQAVPRVMSPTAGLTDLNSETFAGGTLTVEFASFGAADDRLAIRNEGTGAGQIGVTGSTITFGGTAIGTFTGGTGTTPLVVTLNASATVAATQALLRNLTYQNVSVSPVTQRKAVRYTLADGTGQTSNLAIQHVVNSGFTRAPTVAALSPQSVTRGATLTQAGSFTDPFGNARTATVDYGDGSGVQPLTLTGNTFTLSRLYTAAAGNYTITVTVTNDQGGTHTRTMVVTVVDPIGIAPVQVNDGNAQRSRVTSLTVTFTGLVTLPGTPATAFTLTGPSGAIALAVDTSLSTATQTIVRLTFSGSGTQSGSLADGRYTLSVLGNSVLDAQGGGVDGNADGLAGGNSQFALHRLFGDSDGDGDVDNTDFTAFRLALGSSTTVNPTAYRAYFDFDADGDIDNGDFIRFRQRLGTVLPP